MRDKTSPKDIICREKNYWEQQESWDWLAPKSIKKILAFIQKPAGKVLEICIGSGMFTRQIDISGADQYVGLDISPALIKKLKQDLPTTTPVTADGHTPPFKENTFDLVYIFAGLHHLPDVQRALRNVYPILKPGKRFVVFDPNARAFYRPLILFFKNQLKIYTEDETFLNPDNIISILTSVGFKKIQTTYLTPAYKQSWVLHIYPLYLLMRLVALIPSKYTQGFFIITCEK